MEKKSSKEESLKLLDEITEVVNLAKNLIKKDPNPDLASENPMLKSLISGISNTSKKIFEILNKKKIKNISLGLPNKASKSTSTEAFKALVLEDKIKKIEMENLDNKIFVSPKKVCELFEYTPRKTFCLIDGPTKKDYLISQFCTGFALVENGEVVEMGDVNYNFQVDGIRGNQYFFLTFFKIFSKKFLKRKIS